MKPWFEAGKIRIAGRRMRSSDYLKAGAHEIEILDWLKLVRAAAPEASASKRGSFLPIAYEDDDLLALNKASGVASLPLDSNETETAVSSALAHFPKLSELGMGLEPGLLHRLDTGTSGLLLFAKSSEEFERLRGLWRSSAVTKLYRTIAWRGDELIPALPYHLELQVGHSAKSSRRMLVVSAGEESRVRGKPLSAETTLLTSKEILGEPKLVDLELAIHTGVMHQIRCSLAHLRLPILGDPIYCPVEEARTHPLSLSRLWLHHWNLRLPLRSGKELQIDAPLPAGWPPTSD
jgi:23S rRNA pseudouridine1911/1915/1917 synthase